MPACHRRCVLCARQYCTLFRRLEATESPARARGIVATNTYNRRNSGARGSAEERSVSRMTRIVLVLALALGASALLSWSIYRYAIQPAQAREDAFAALVAGQISPGAAGVTPLPPK